MFFGNAVLKLHIFKLVYCIFAIVIVRHFPRSLMALNDCQKILLTYLLITDIKLLSAAAAADDDDDDDEFELRDACILFDSRIALRSTRKLP